MATARSILKNYFLTGKKPTQGQFAALIDSFLHLSEDAISITQIENLQSVLAGKASTAQIDALVQALTAKADLPIMAPNFAALPVSGQIGKTYVTTDTVPNLQYRWSGTGYIAIGGGGGGASSFTDLAGLPYDNPALAIALNAKEDRENQLLTGCELTTTATTVNIAAGTWLVNAIVYSISTVTSFVKPVLCSTGLFKTFAVYGQNDGQIVSVTSLQSATVTPPENNVPNSALLRWLLISDSTYATQTIEYNRFVLKTDIYNALDQTTAGKVLDARQGKTLNDLITAITAANALKAAQSALDAHTSNTLNPHNTTLEQARSQNNSFAGEVNMATNKLLNLPAPTSNNEPIRKIDFDSYVSATGSNRDGIDCSANPLYPVAIVGDRFEVTVAGKIGGALGVNVDNYDEIVCKIANTTTGTHAAVGANFYIVQGNIERATEATSGYVQLATIAEALFRTDDQKALTALKSIALILDEKKNFNMQFFVSRQKFFQVYMLNAGALSAITQSGLTGLVVRVGTGGSFATATFPLTYTAAQMIYFQFDFTDQTTVTGNIVLTGKDN